MILRAAPFADLAAATLYSLLRLRCDVFIVEQQCAYPELDGRDLEPDTRHLWLSATADAEPAAYLRMLTEPDGTARIGRVCTAAGYRGQGLAARLMITALDLIGPARTCTLHAQAHLVDFYRRFDFRVTGDEYLEDGIPHVPMTRPGSMLTVGPAGGGL